MRVLLPSNFGFEIFVKTIEKYAMLSFPRAPHDTESRVQISNEYFAHFPRVLSV